MPQHRPRTTPTGGAPRRRARADGVRERAPNKWLEGLPAEEPVQRNRRKRAAPPEAEIQSQAHPLWNVVEEHRLQNDPADRARPDEPEHEPAHVTAKLKHVDR